MSAFKKYKRVEMRNEFSDFSDAEEGLLDLTNPRHEWRTWSG